VVKSTHKSPIAMTPARRAAWASYGVSPIIRESVAAIFVRSRVRDLAEAFDQARTKGTR
jgi:hypothetical protein